MAPDPPHPYPCPRCGATLTAAMAWAHRCPAQVVKQWQRLASDWRLGWIGREDDDG